MKEMTSKELRTLADEVEQQEQLEAQNEMEYQEQHKNELLELESDNNRLELEAVKLTASLSEDLTVKAYRAIESKIDLAKGQIWCNMRRIRYIKKGLKFHEYMSSIDEGTEIG